MKALYIYLTIFGSVCFFSKTKAQDTTATKPNEFILNGIGIMASPYYSFQRNYPDFYKGLIASELGISLTVKLNKTFILFSELGYRTNRQQSQVPNTTNLIDSQGNINFDNITYFDATHQFNYYSVTESLGGNLFKLSNKIIFFGSIGIKGSYFTNGRLTLYDKITNDKIITSIEENERYNFSVVSRFGTCQKISKKLRLITSPQFIYDISNTTSFSRSFWSIGLNLQLIYNFKNDV